jgi:tartrate dehydratase alpha subunit/fumarate hydratase class I-like protein
MSFSENRFPLFRDMREEAPLQLDINEVEELAKTLYIRALKLLPPDIKRGFERLQAQETDATGRAILGTMVQNIAVAERTRNLLCQDTGIPIYNVTIGKNVDFDGVAMKEAIRRGCERATREHPLRSSVVHPVTRKNEQTSCGIGVPLINVDFDTRDETVEIEMIPKGSGSENGSFLQMLIPAAASVRRPSSASASAAPRTFACTSPRWRRPARSAPPAAIRKAPGSKPSSAKP